MARRDIQGAVDFAYLAAYAADDLALMEEVLGIFEEQQALWLRLLDPHGEAGAWRDGAHTMKGAAASIGARALADLCGEAEQGFAADPAVKAALLARLSHGLALVLADIAAWRHEAALRSLKGP
jgi:HPt (histidine-containing phosphotransfer) domain-containing protein